MTLVILRLARPPQTLAAEESFAGWDWCGNTVQARQLGHDILPERRLAQGLMRRSRLDSGEAEAIAIAGTRDTTLVVDDKDARSVAATMDVAFLGTAAVLPQAYLTGRLGLDDLEDAVRNLSKAVWLSPSRGFGNLEASPGGTAMKKEQMVGARLLEHGSRALAHRGGRAIGPLHTCCDTVA